MDCCICTENIELPYKTTCNHNFCYPCIKTSFMFGNLECPLCRKSLPNDICDNAESDITIDTKNYCWIYSGRNEGYWYYTQDLNEIIEKSYIKYLDDPLQNLFDVMILNKKYIINFDDMVQIRSDNMNIIRKIVRIDENNISQYNIKGVSGLKVNIQN